MALTIMRVRRRSRELKDESKDALRIESDGGITRWTMCGPRGNAMGSAMIEALEEAASCAAGDPDCRGVLLRSERSLFCPGLDLAEAHGYDREEMACLIDGFTGMVRRLHRFPKPLVAALGGDVLAGGMLVALAADWRVIGAQTRIGLNEMRVGAPLPFPMARLLAASVPPGSLTDVALAGKNFAGEDAVAAGLAHESAPPDEVESRAETKLAELADQHADAFATTKHFLRASTAAVMEAGEAEHRDRFLDVWFSPEARARLDAAHARLFGAKATGDRGDME